MVGCGGVAPGHIQLHGLQQPEQAALSYQRVLDSEPEATLAALAEQGLELCRSQNTVSAARTTPANDVAIPDLLKDPFLTTDPDQATPAQPNVVTAMPWLPSAEEPRTTAAGTPTPAPAPEPTVTLEPEITTEPTEQPPSDEIEVEVEPTTQEPAAKDLLEKSWLRRQLQPAIKSPTDSAEPMGLMNRIKGALARSAGR